MRGEERNRLDDLAECSERQKIGLQPLAMLGFISSGCNCIHPRRTLARAPIVFREGISLAETRELRESA